ncbi:MAG: hypothetical protein QN183_12285 [Armatimonadota bacterium]|nr:hypothetical protein [Armatimonadota bacterium]MDR7537129.1 hypothetical protein [Armatimonadota bacterium]
MTHADLRRPPVRRAFRVERARAALHVTDRARRRRPVHGDRA